MKPSVKAALLSGLVFPGAGHIYLKRYAIGIVLIAIAIAATWWLMSNAVHAAFAISDKIAAGEVPLDETAISNMVTQQTQQVAMSSTIATYALGIAWLIGIIDSYRLGVAKERSALTTTKK